MGACCNNIQNVNNNVCGCGCGRNNCTTIIIAAIIALVLVNVVNEDTADCIGQFLQAIGQLVELSSSGSCFGNLVNNCCNYY